MMMKATMDTANSVGIANTIRLTMKRSMGLTVGGNRRALAAARMPPPIPGAPYLAGLSKYHWVSVGAGCQRLPVIGMPLTTFFRLFDAIMYFGMGREMPMMRKLSADRLDRKSVV